MSKIGQMVDQRVDNESLLTIEVRSFLGTSRVTPTDLLKWS